jgi:hypothetical protein
MRRGAPWSGIPANKPDFPRLQKVIFRAQSGRLALGWLALG